MHDPSFPLAARYLEKRPAYRAAARLAPDLAIALPPAADGMVPCNVVLVHGGLSNGLADFSNGLIGGKAPLLADIAGCRFRVFRYEHDTWLPVGQNVAELVDLVERKIRGRHLLFIALSRGGIVATRAAALLRERGRVVPEADDSAIARGVVGDIEVMTFGSPHTGFRTSNVVARIPRLGYCLQFLVSESTRDIPKRIRQAIFFESLRRLKRLPPGIADLTPRNKEFREFIRSHEGRWIADRLHAFGGAPVGPSWLPRPFRGCLAWPVLGIGDGAVSLSSAIAYGASRNELKGCRHSGYFLRAEVRRAIRGRLVQLCGEAGCAQLDDGV